MPCAKCIELERQLRESWEAVLRLDKEIQTLSEIVNSLTRQADAPETRSL